MFSDGSFYSWRRKYKRMAKRLSHLRMLHETCAHLLEKFNFSVLYWLVFMSGKYETYFINGLFMGGYPLFSYFWIFFYLCDFLFRHSLSLLALKGGLDEECGGTTLLWKDSLFVRWHAEWEDGAEQGGGSWTTCLASTSTLWKISIITYYY